MRIIVLAVLLGLLTGCIYPHRTERSPEIFGRVIDARSGIPIKSAKVFLTDHPTVSDTTDAAGKFHLKATSNFHLVGIPPEGDWPARKYWGASVTVSHPMYTEFTQRGADDWRLTDKGDILLKPKQ